MNEGGKRVGGWVHWGGNEVSLSRTLLVVGLVRKSGTFVTFNQIWKQTRWHSHFVMLCVFWAHCTAWSTVNAVGNSFFFARRYVYSWLAHSFRLEFSVPDEFSAFEYL
jgi:hypothetical protein